MGNLTINLPTKIGGHPKQEWVWACTSRFIDLLWGRRAGKDWIGTRKMIKNIYQRDFRRSEHEQKSCSIRRDIPRLYYWCVAPSYALCKVVSKHLFGFLPEEIIQEDNTRSNTPNIWLYPEIKIEFKSGERPERLVGEGLNGLYVTETARLKSSTWNDNLQPTLADKEGWGIFTTTPIGRNWYMEEIRPLCEEGDQRDEQWSGFHAKTVENTKMPGLVAEVERARKTMPKKYFLRNYEASADAFQGQIFDEFDSSIHLQDWEIDKSIYKVIVGGVDWGYTHHGGFVIIGITNDDDVHILEENTQSGIPCVSADNNQDTWAKRALEAQTRWGTELFYCGVDEPEHIKAFRDAGIYARGAKNAVQPGIQTIATLMHIDENKHTRLKIHKSNCPRLSKYIAAYRWMENKDGDLQEKPLKVNDDEIDMARYAIHSARKWLKFEIPQEEEEAAA